MRPPPPLAPTLLLAAATLGRAQAPIPPATPNSIGSVEVSAASLSGSLSLADGRALIGSSAVVIAHDRTATVHLTRGGEVLVCSTSVLHAARSDTRVEPAPLLLALDHGAVEIHMAASTRDAILTPDLRLSIVPPAGQSSLAGVLDLRLRVATNGDTCIENRGAHAPTLEASEQFGSGLYRVGPGQHILFEHGSLREVVDDETSPCGCPPPPVLSVASNGISTDVTRAARPGAAVADDPDEVRPHTSVADTHPFPTAESQGLTPTENPAATVPQAPPNEPHAQVAATLAFAPTAGFDGSTPNPPSPPAAGQPASGAASPSPRPATSAAAQSPSGPTPAATAPTPPAAAPPSGGQPAAPAPVASATPVTPPAQPSSPAPSSAPRATPTPQPPPAPLASATPSPMQDPGTVHEIAQAPLPPAAPPAHTVFHRIGHFFHHLFTGEDTPGRSQPTAATRPQA